MPRSKEYQRFLDFKNGKIPDNLPPDEEIEASDREIGWWEKEQIARALTNTRNSVATPEEIELLEKHQVDYSWRAKKRTFKHKEKIHQS